MEQEQKIEIQVNDQIANGVYSNLIVVNHQQSEFTFDFIYLQPGTNTGKVVSRVVMTSDNAKKFGFALSENLSKYEKKHGKISG